MGFTLLYGSGFTLLYGSEWYPQIGVVEELKERVSQKLCDRETLDDIHKLARCFVRMWFINSRPKYFSQGIQKHVLDQNCINLNAEVPDAPVILNIPAPFLLYVFKTDHERSAKLNDWLMGTHFF